jgi:hypothetical protein
MPILINAELATTNAQRPPSHDAMSFDYQRTTFKLVTAANRIFVPRS